MSVPVPDTPAGRQAEWALASFGKLLKGREIRARFAPSFLEAVSPLKVRAVMLSLRAHLPITVESVTGDERQLSIFLAGARGPLVLQVGVSPDEPHLITGMLVQPPAPKVGDVLQGAQPSSDLEGLLDEHIEPFAQSLRGKRAGLVAAVHFAGSTTVRTYGAVSDDSVFEIGSVTKPITATLLAQMVVSGEVALEDPAERFLPSGARMPQTDGGPITLLELATHTSGLPRLPVNLDVRDPGDPYRDFTLDDLFEGLASTPLDSRGTIAYSNLGFGLLGQALARAAGSDYATLVHDVVLQPLGMVDSRVGPNSALEARRIPGHDGGKVVPHWTQTATAPAGAVEAPVRDVLAFALALASAEPGSALQATQIKRLPYGTGQHIGLAWVIVEMPHGDVCWHNGGTGGFHSFVGFHAASGTAIAVLNNSSDRSDGAAAAILGSLVQAS